MNACPRQLLSQRCVKNLRHCVCEHPLMQQAKRAGDVMVIRIDHPVDGTEIQPIIQSCQMLGLSVRVGVIDGVLGIALTPRKNNNMEEIK